MAFMAIEISFKLIYRSHVQMFNETFVLKTNIKSMKAFSNWYKPCLFQDVPVKELENLKMGE